MKLVGFLFTFLLALPMLSEAKAPDYSDCNLNKPNGCAGEAPEQKDLNGNPPNYVIPGLNKVSEALDNSKKTPAPVSTQAWLSPALTSSLTANPYTNLIEQNRSNSDDQDSAQ